MLTCKPCAPTNVKKADKKALRAGPAPAATMLVNSPASIVRKQAPSTKVTTIQKSNARESVRLTASTPNPHVTLDASRHIVSRNTWRLSNSSIALGPPAVEPDSTE